MDMVAKQQWFKQLGDAEIPGWVTSIGKVIDLQVLETEMGRSEIKLYRVVTQSGAIQTIMALDPITPPSCAEPGVILSSRDIAVLAGLLLSASYAPDANAFTRFVEAPEPEAPKPETPPRRRGTTPLAGRPLDEDGAIELNARATAAAVDRDVLELFRSLRLETSQCLPAEDAQWLESREARVQFSAQGPDHVRLTVLCPNVGSRDTLPGDLGRIHVAAPGMNEAVVKARRAVAALN